MGEAKKDEEERNEFRSTRRVGRPDFVPFDEERAVRIYRRNLPHWRQDGATYRCYQSELLTSSTVRWL
jgi:hypothetical protein